MIGKRISHFYVIRQLGSGGMGVVYEAQDTRLPRSVAIKFLKSTLANDEEALRRFKREARLASSLNHPNICTILDVEEADGQAFIAMELLQGQSLKARLSGEPLSLREIIDIAMQIADALTAAHAEGIVHRDIAPGNVFLTESGFVKLLDFGLAKHFETHEDGETPDAMTGSGTVAGTIHYMSPEQLSPDEPVDFRSDLYSLGILLYQMATGVRPFDDVPKDALIAAIGSRPHAPVRQLAPHQPAELEQIIDKLLAKRPRDRYEGARALRADLNVLRDAVPEVTRPPINSRRARATVAAVVGVLAVGAWFAWRTWGPAAAPSYFVVRSLLNDASPGSMITLTPDGSTIVYTGSLDAGRPLMLLPVGQLVGHAMAGTQGASKPFIAPSGKQLAFFSSDDKLKTIPIEGGTATDAGAAWQFGDGGWDGDSAIVTDGFRNLERGLSRRVLGGRTPSVLTRPDTGLGEVTHAAPLVLPGTRMVVFTIVNTAGGGPSPRGGQLAIASLDHDLGSGVQALHVPLGVRGRRAFAVLGDWVLYTSEDGGSIMAVRLDTQRQRIVGPPIAVLTDSAANMETASLATNGTLMYVRRSRNNSAVLVDAKGAVQPLLGATEGTFMYPRFSPDGKRFAVQVTSSKGTDISVYDIASRARTQLTTSGRALHPTWTPGGRIVYWSVVGSAVDFWSQRPDSAEPALSIVRGDRSFAPTVTPDGRTLVFQQFVDSAWGVWSAVLDGDRTPRRVFADSFSNLMPAISPNGRWLAYVSRRAKRPFVFVRAFPGPGTPVQVSEEEGTEPGWSPDGRQIYYRAKRSLMAAQVTTPVLGVVARERLFDGAFDGEMPHRNYDVRPDGKHFLMIATASAANAEAVVGLNWLPAVRARLNAAAK